MNRFFALYDRTVRLFALALLAFSLLYFLLSSLFTKGVDGMLDRIMFGEEQPPIKDQQLFNLSKNPPPPLQKEEEPSLIL